MRQVEGLFIDLALRAEAGRFASVQMGAALYPLNPERSSDLILFNRGDALKALICSACSLVPANLKIRPLTVVKN